MRSTNVGKLTLVLVLLGVVGMIALRPWLARDRGVFPVTGSMGPSEGNVVDRTVAGEAGDSDLDDNQVATPTLDPALVAAVEATMLAARGGTPGPPGEAENYLRIDYDDAPPAAPAAETAYYVRMKTREAKALAMPSATTDWAETPTPPYPVPLSEDDAIAWALSYALEGTSPHDPIARKIAHATPQVDATLGPHETLYRSAVYRPTHPAEMSAMYAMSDYDTYWLGLQYEQFEFVQADRRIRLGADVRLMAETSGRAVDESDEFGVVYRPTAYPEIENAHLLIVSRRISGFHHTIAMSPRATPISIQNASDAWYTSRQDSVGGNITFTRGGTQVSLSSNTPIDLVQAVSDLHTIQDDAP